MVVKLQLFFAVVVEELLIRIATYAIRMSQHFKFAATSTLFHKISCQLFWLSVPVKTGWVGRRAPYFFFFFFYLFVAYRHGAKSWIFCLCFVFQK
jgi:hypothetical protein